jgi:hypothetical protein
MQSQRQSQRPSRGLVALVYLALVAATGCDDPPAPAQPQEPAGPPGGGRGGSDGGRLGAGPIGTGEAGGAGSGGAGGVGAPDAGADTSSPPSGPINAGGVGEQPLVPLRYTATPVPPLIEPECPGDPTEGFSEYMDSFVVQRPRNLPAADRFKYEDGVYTFWVQSNDQPHKPNNGTAPRTEARYSDISTGEHVWSADVMYESPSRTCIMQIHNVVGSIAVYLRVQGNRLFNLSTGTTILTDYTGKWFNLKVYFNPTTRQVRTYVNNCLKEESRAPGGTPYWYYKHGVYTCDSGTCRSSYKNVHLYQKGSTDTFNTRSTYP